MSFFKEKSDFCEVSLHMCCQWNYRFVSNAPVWHRYIEVEKEHVD